MLDLLGRSLLDYQKGDRSDDVHVETNISEREILFRSHFFRSFSQMIPLEQLALTMAQGTWWHLIYQLLLLRYVSSGA